MRRAMHGFLHDLKIGARGLLKTRWTTLSAVLILALGTGVNTSVLAVAYGILLRPLPYDDPSRIVVLGLEADQHQFGVPLAEFEEWRSRLRAIRQVGAYSSGEFTMRGAGEARTVRAALVKGDFFDVLGTQAVEGRQPSDAEGDGWVVVNRHQAGLMNGGRVVGRSVAVGQGTYTIRAVLPDTFAFPTEEIEVWLPPSTITAIPVLGERNRIDARTYSIIGRLAPGVTLEQARGDAVRVLTEIRGGKPAREVHLTVVPLVDVLTGRVRPVLMVLAGAAILVLLVACGNVASLLVGRAAAGSHDLAVRLALGATRWHLVRAVLAESVIVAAAASAAGVAMGYVLIRLFVRVAAGVFPRLEAISIDLPVLALTAVIAFAVTLLCGAAPALNAARGNFAPAFRGRSASASRGTRRLRGFLVAAQIALSIVLLTGAGLVVQTVTRLLQQATGIDTRHVVSARLVMTDTTTFAASSRAPFVSQVLERVRALPGVQAAGIGSALPPRVSPLSMGINIVRDGRSNFQAITLASVTPGYFAAIGARLIRGRLFEEADLNREPAVAVLSQSAARHLFPTKDAVEQTLYFSLPPIAGRARRPRIVGVVGDIRYSGLDSSSTGTVYLLWNDLPAGTSYLVVRGVRDGLALAPALRGAIRSVDGSMPIPDVRTLDDEIMRSIADRRLRVLPSASFALLALGVALVGLSAAVARGVAERRRELAIRGVLGATPARNLHLVVGEGVRWTALGVVAGVAGACAVGRALSRLLFGVSAYDATTFVAVALAVAAAALGVCYVAARRASRVDLLDLLRAE